MPYLSLNALATAAHPSMNPASALTFLLGHTELLPTLGYWEQDENHRIVCVLAPRHGGGTLEPAAFVGRLPWETGGEPLVGWDEVRARFERRETFHELVLRYTGPAGRVHHTRHTLQARFDAAGGFIGYHGVFEDLTHLVALARGLIEPA